MRRGNGKGWIEMVSCCPHPEERACRRRAGNWIARARVSKDEDERAPSCFETHRSAVSTVEGLALAYAAMLLSMRATGTNLRLYEMGAGRPSLFPPCSLQGTVQLQRVGLRRAQTLFTAMWSRKAMRRAAPWSRLAVGFEDRRASNCVSSPRGAPPATLASRGPRCGDP
jgi:hypothetical protein